MHVLGVKAQRDWFAPLQRHIAVEARQYRADLLDRGVDFGVRAQPLDQQHLGIDIAGSARGDVQMFGAAGLRRSAQCHVVLQPQSARAGGHVKDVHRG